MRAKAIAVCVVSSVVAGFVACGDDGGAHHLPDAPPSDGTTSDTTTLEPVTLTITLDGVPREGIDVYFQNADSSLVAKVPTDANGVASATVQTNAFVTVVNPFASTGSAGVAYDDIRTFAGVKPGDHLRMTERFTDALTFVNLVADIDNTATSYQVFSTCRDPHENFYLNSGSGGLRPTTSMDLLNCGANADFLVETMDGSGNSLNYTYKENVAVAPDPAIIDLAGAYAATTATTVTYQNVPAEITEMRIENVIANTHGPLWARPQQLVSPATTTTVYNLKRPAITGMSIFQNDVEPTGSIAFQSIIDWSAVAATHAFDLANTLLRPFTGAPTFDIAAHAITWTESAGVAPDFAVAGLYAVRSGASTQTWSWQIVGVPQAAALVFPVLPTEIARYNPVTGDSLSTNDLATAKVPGGYDGVRAIVMAINDPAELAIGASGRMVVQQYYGNRSRTVPAVRPWMKPAAPVAQRR